MPYIVIQTWICWCVSDYKGIQLHRAGVGITEYLSHKVEHSVMQTDWRLKFETTASVGFVWRCRKNAYYVKCSGVKEIESI